MKKVYVRFGDMDDLKLVICYVGLLQDGVVNIINPKTNYRGLGILADDMSFNEDKTYIIDGKIIDYDDKGRIMLGKVKVIRKLYYDPETENYLWEDPNVTLSNVPDKVLFNNIEEYVSDKQLELMDKIGFWNYFWGSMTAGFPKLW